MSLPSDGALRVLHIPAGVGLSWWVYRDKDTITVAHEETGGTIAVV